MFNECLKQIKLDQTALPILPWRENLMQYITLMEMHFKLLQNINVINVNTSELLTMYSRDEILQREFHLLMFMLYKLQSMS